MKDPTTYAVVVFLGDHVQVYKTASRKRMLDTVREVAAKRLQYKVLTPPQENTTNAKN